MNLQFDMSLSEKYKSSSQKIRAMSENWISKNMFCPCCGNPHIFKLKNNLSVADMQCDYCGEIFEIKAKKGKIGKKINNGAYSTMINRITSSTNPELLVMQYSQNYEVTNLTFIPKFFFVPQIIEKRKPLAATAKRAGWIGCNILYSEIPKQGKISIIHNGNVKRIQDVVDYYTYIKQLKTTNLNSRGWLLDVLNCINDIASDEFTLDEMYNYVEILQQKHLNNNNVKAKIRQQLQRLRDKNIIEFLGNGNYKKL